MKGNLLRRLWDRRKASRQTIRHLSVHMADVEGNIWELASENLSSRGIWLRSDRTNAGWLAANRERVPLEIRLQEEAAPVRVRGELLWTYPTSDGGMMSGWRFACYEVIARLRLWNYLDRCESDTAAAR